MVRRPEHGPGEGVGGDREAREAGAGVGVQAEVVRVEGVYGEQVPVGGVARRWRGTGVTMDTDVVA